MRAAFVLFPEITTVPGISWRPCPKKITVKRILYHLENLAPDFSGRIENVYFGHTHRPFSNFAYKGIFFHNTGSAIKGMKYNMLEFEIQDSVTI